MTPKERLITVRENAPKEQVLALLHKHRIEKVLVIAGDHELKGMITVKDFQKATEFPNACKDSVGSLRVGAAVGTAPDTIERVAALREAGVDVVVVDTSHGHSRGVLEMVSKIKKQFSDLQVIGGNIVTAEAALDLVKHGADGVKVGIGPGSICTTRVVAGVGVPQISAIARVAKALEGSGVPVIGDGGIRYSGDIAKALAAGAHCVMIGGMFAGTEESPGDVELYQGGSYKAYRGMGSLGAMAQAHGSSDRYFQDTTSELEKLVPEGIEGRVPYKGSLVAILHQLSGRVARGHGLHRQRQHRGDAHASAIRAHHQCGCARKPRARRDHHQRSAQLPDRVMTDIHADRVLILDFGAQYTQLIARRVRELGVYSEIFACDVDGAKIKAFAPKAIILSGGPESVYDVKGHQAPMEVFDLGVPVLGICYGMQTMAAQLGGQVEMSTHREFGAAQVRPTADSRLLDGLEDNRDAQGRRVLDVWMSHGDRVVAAPPGFRVTAASDNAPLAAMSDESRKLYGLQFHPEVTHSLQGGEILRRFVREIAACAASWGTQNIIDDSMARIRAAVRGDQVLLGLSGGVDSSVLAALLHKAIGTQLTCVFVDHGLLRLGEGDQVMATFAEHMGVRVVRVDAEQRFLDALAGEVDPEKKRKIIGRIFIEVFDEEAAKLKDVKWLAQGTIYPDVIESAGSKTGKAHVIKSHHNVGGLPETMKLKLLEPLRELFKDEVRKLGFELGLPKEMVQRHPFPGPGLGVRILGEVRKVYADLLRRADAIFIEELRTHALYDKVSQAFAVFLPVRSVGVMGDGRRYDHVVALRAVETIDFMTARWARLPYEFLDRVAHRVINEVPGISRVVYDISGKPPATIEWE